MTRPHDFAPHLSLASAHDYLEMPEIAPSLPAFYRFYQRYGQLAVRVSRVIDTVPVQFSIVTASKMTRDAKRTALVLLEDDSDYDDKHYRLFTHQLGHCTLEYRIVETCSYLTNDYTHPESIAMYHAQAIDQDLDPRYREGILQLGATGLSASLWTVDNHEIVLESLPKLTIPADLVVPDRYCRSPLPRLSHL